MHEEETMENPGEMPVARYLDAGAHLVSFSGDKLLGGPQAGVIVGRKDLVDQITANPMKRALRCDKMTMAALSSVLRLYANPDRLKERLPTLRWLTRSCDDVAAMTLPAVDALRKILGEGAVVEMIDCESQIGSGALPTRTLPSKGISIAPGSDIALSSGKWLGLLAASFRRLDKPVIGRIHDDRFVLDLRCLDSVAEFISSVDQLEMPQ